MLNKTNSGQLISTLRGELRTKNPHHTDTVENEKDKVVATNWSAFSVGDVVSLSAVIEFLSQSVNDTTFS